MQIVPGLHLVDGMGAVVNVYVWERPDGGLTLIDAGHWLGVLLLQALVIALVGL